MKYGNSLKITISDVLTGIPRAEFYAVLSEKPNAKATLKETFSNIEKWIDSTARSLIATEYLTDEQLLNALLSRGLITRPVDTKPLPELYFIESRSGDTNGHYIELYGASDIRCTCPGFVNNGKCWASTEIVKAQLSSGYRRNTHKWSASRENFYEHRSSAYDL